MGISLQKGQRVDLTKGNAGLSTVVVGLGWDQVQGSGPQVDCDASVVLLGDDSKLHRQEHIIYFGNLSSPEGSVRHMGDNLTGAGDGDDEQIFIELARIPADVHRMAFIVNIYDCVNRGQHFGMIQNAFIRVVNNANRQELLRFNLTENYSGRTALLVAEVYRHQGEWKFSALGEGTNDPGLKEVIRRYV